MKNIRSLSQIPYTTSSLSKRLTKTETWPPPHPPLRCQRPLPSKPNSTKVSKPSKWSKKTDPSQSTTSTAHLNVLFLPFFSKVPRALSLLDRHPSAHAIVLSAHSPHFSAGIDLSSLSPITTNQDSDHDGSLLASPSIATSFPCNLPSPLKLCRQPVTPAVHDACIDDHVDLIAACDLCYCTVNAYFSIKEVDMALAADLGLLQRLPSIIGYGRVMDLALTGRSVKGLEAKEMGLVSTLYGLREEMEATVDEIFAPIVKMTSIRALLAIMAVEDLHLEQPDVKTVFLHYDVE